MQLGLILKLTLVSTTIGIVMGANAIVLALEPAPTKTKIAQASSPSGAANSNPLKLTPEQQGRIQMILKNQNILIVSVLTPQQKAIVQKAAQGTQQPGSVEASLNLTPEQKTKIKSIQEQADQQIRGVLTPQQLKMVDQSQGQGK
jgi:Spy/CpxP family protein refolding chaperone